MKMYKPKRLKKGSSIAIISPSWGGPFCYQHIYEKGLERLREFGFNIVEYPTAKMDSKKIYENPKLRAEDINRAFKDKNIEGIISTIGGEESIRVLPYLDSNIIKSNPKFFMGYSDITTFNTYFNQLGLVTFNGPSVMAGFAESKKLEDDFVDYINEFLFGEWNEFEYKKFKRYTSKYLAWNEPKNLDKKNSNYILDKENWNFIQGEKLVRGELFGGCIEVLEFMKGTKFWPKKDFWDGKILFFETSENKPTPSQVSWFLRNYGMQGILEKTNGIIFGRARDYSKDEKKDLEKLIIKILKEFNREDLTVVTNVDFGHTDPQLIMPLGIKIQINPKGKSLKLVESIWEN